MADLTLSDFDVASEEELVLKLKEEIVKMFGEDCSDHNPDKKNHLSVVTDFGLMERALNLVLRLISCTFQSRLGFPKLK